MYKSLRLCHCFK